MMKPVHFSLQSKFKNIDCKKKKLADLQKSVYNTFIIKHTKLIDLLVQNCNNLFIIKYIPTP